MKLLKSYAPSRIYGIFSIYSERLKKVVIARNVVPKKPQRLPHFARNDLIEDVTLFKWFIIDTNTKPCYEIKQYEHGDRGS